MKMESKQGIHVMTLANSIIGVSILAMPYCFKQCGIILSIILLIFSSILSRLACHFLLKSAIKARLRTFEFLAYHVFGSLGKLFVEIGMIGFLIGTCIAFFVVMGDLSPQIVAHMTGTESTDTLRTLILIALGVFCVLPLGLLRNVDSLSGVCTATIGFYGCLVLKIMGESAPHLLVGDWFDTVNYWRPAGILQCIPIFSMALFCQTQLFEIYQAIPNASLEKMNNLVRLAVNICTCVYIFVGVFGYIAISHEVNFTGNILMNFKPSIMTEVMKIGFVLSVAFSFPLVIFPCRASLYSLIYKPTYSALHESTSFYIPETKFRLLTFLIVLVSLIIGVLIPNIELVLGLVGSTIGVMICVLFPATCFICLTSKNTNERILAQIMLFIGIIMMVLGTYANLYAMEQVTHGVNTEKSISIKNEVDLNTLVKDKEKLLLTTFVNIISDDVNKEIRHEPPQPEAPMDEVEKKADDKAKHILQDAKIELQNVAPKAEVEVPLNKTKEVQKTDDLIVAKNGEIDKEAIKKEDKELEQGDKNYDRKIYEEQHKLIIEQKKILNELKKTHERQMRFREEEKEEKVKAVKNIETLARLAIESLVDDKTKIEQNGKDKQKNEDGKKVSEDNTLIQKAINNLDVDKKRIEKAIENLDEDKQSNEGNKKVESKLQDNMETIKDIPINQTNHQKDSPLNNKQDANAQKESQTKDQNKTNVQMNMPLQKEYNNTKANNASSNFKQSIEELKNMAPIPLVLAPNLNPKQFIANNEQLNQTAKVVNKTQKPDEQKGVLNLLQNGGGLPKNNNQTVSKNSSTIRSSNDVNSQKSEEKEAAVHVKQENAEVKVDDINLLENKEQVGKTTGEHENKTEEKVVNYDRIVQLIENLGNKMGKNEDGVEAKNQRDESVNREENDGKNRKAVDSKNEDVQKLNVADKPDGETNSNLGSNHRDILSEDNYLRRKRDLEEIIDENQKQNNVHPGDTKVNDDDKHCEKSGDLILGKSAPKSISDEVR